MTIDFEGKSNITSAPHLFRAVKNEFQFLEELKSDQYFVKLLFFREFYGSHPFNPVLNNTPHPKDNYNCVNRKKLKKTWKIDAPRMKRKIPGQRTTEIECGKTKSPSKETFNTITDNHKYKVAEVWNYV